jgi:hypothetical protein
MGPQETRNQKRSCWRRPAAIYCIPTWRVKKEFATSQTAKNLIEKYFKNLIPIDGKNNPFDGGVAHIKGSNFTATTENRISLSTENTRSFVGLHSVTSQKTEIFVKGKGQEIYIKMVLH